MYGETALDQANGKDLKALLTAAAQKTPAQRITEAKAAAVAETAKKEEAACADKGFKSCAALAMATKEAACKKHGFKSCAHEQQQAEELAAKEKSAAIAAAANADAETVDTLLKFAPEQVEQMLVEEKYKLPKRLKVQAAIARIVAAGSALKDAQEGRAGREGSGGQGQSGALRSAYDEI